MAKEKTYSKCSGCGGNLIFCPETQDMICEKCSGHTDIEKDSNVAKHEYVQGQSARDNNGWEEGKTFRCETCGACVNLSGLEISKTCPYCGSTFVSEAKSLPGLKPDGIIPFAFDKKGANEWFKRGIKSRFFLPNAFKKNLPESKIHGLYVPCFSFDANTYSTYRGILERHYTTTDKDGNSRTRVETFPISGDISLSLDDVVTEASASFEQSEMNSVLPYDHREAVVYKPGFVRGYYVEHYETNVDTCHNTARNVMSSQIKHEILSKYMYDEVRSLTVNTDYTNEKYCYKLLPVYRFEYTYKNKKYMNCMNGQTGKMNGKLPKSGVKIFFTVFGIALFVIAFMLLFMFLPMH